MWLMAEIEHPKPSFADKCDCCGRPVKSVLVDDLYFCYGCFCDIKWLKRGNHNGY